MSKEHSIYIINVKLTSSCLPTSLLFLSTMFPYPPVLSVRVQKDLNTLTHWNNTGHAMREPCWPLRPPSGNQWFMAGLCIVLISYPGHALMAQTLIDIHGPNWRGQWREVNTLNVFFFSNFLSRVSLKRTDKGQLTADVSLTVKEKAFKGV